MKQQDKKIRPYIIESVKQGVPYETILMNVAGYVTPDEAEYLRAYEKQQDKPISEELINAQLLFEMFDKEIKKRKTLVFTSEENKWYERLKRQLLKERKRL